LKKKAIPLYMFSFIMIMPLAGLFPVLPMIRDEIHASYSQISLFISIIGIVRLLLAVPTGFLVDRFDKKNILRCSGFFCLCGLIALSTAHTISQLIVSRMFIGASSIICNLTILVALSELAGTNDKGATISMNNVLHNAGAILGPALTGFLASYYNWRIPFLVLAGLVLLSMIMVEVTIPRQSPTHHRIRPSKNVAEKHQFRKDWIPLVFKFIPVFGISLLVFFYRSSFRHTLIPFYGKDVFHVGVETLGVYIAISAFVSMVSVFVFGYMSDRYGRKTVFIPGILLSAMAVMTFLLPDRLNPLLLANIFVGMGAIINTIPGIIISDLAPPGSIGKIMGINRIFADSGYFLGSIVTGGILDNFGFRMPLYTVIIVCIFTLGLIGFSIHNRPPAFTPTRDQ